MIPKPDLPAICAALQRLQRRRRDTMGFRIAILNRLQAIVAGTLGYRAGLPEKERAALFKEAGKVIREVEKGEAADPLEGLIPATLAAVEPYDAQQKLIEKEMLARAALLPAAAWCELPEQRGFGLLSLATVVGEAGDLGNYANPAKLWKRLGCAPHSFRGRTLMGATWKAGKDGKESVKLDAREWDAFGYCPRRRSIAYILGENLLKLNYVRGSAGGDVPPDTEPRPATPARARKQTPGKAGDIMAVTDGLGAGPYRARYDEARAAALLAHPDWPKLRLHRHGMLLTTKRLLRNLWRAWRGQQGEATGVVTPTEVLPRAC